MENRVREDASLSSCTKGILNPRICVQACVHYMCIKSSNSENQIIYSNTAGNTRQMTSNTQNGFPRPLSSMLCNPAGESISLTSCTKEFLWFLFLTFSIMQPCSWDGRFVNMLENLLPFSWVKPSISGQETFLISDLSPGQNLRVDIEQANRLEVLKDSITHYSGGKRNEAKFVQGVAVLILNSKKLYEHKS